MTQEEKDLLLEDLCVRLPYGVICRFTDTFDGCEVDNVLHPDDITDMFRHRSHCDSRIDVKPYLRPLSSMTDEEYEEFCATRLEHQLKCIEIDEKRRAFEAGMKFDAEDLEYLYSHHYDVRGLIPMGLAISTETFNPYK